MKLIFAIIFSFFTFTSFKVGPKPHLIVGNWQLIENEKQKIEFSKDGKNYWIDRLTFSSDEIQSDFTLVNIKSKSELGVTFAFHFFEPFDEFTTPVVLFKNICDKKTRLVFSIVELDKSFLKVRFEKKYSSENINLSTGIMTFERTAGPPENMP
ncbi:MAG: hypothetical protein ACKO5C_00150 [Ferruginibacter sp.]